MIMIGIYCILNKQNNKRYIGSSTDINRRLTTHKRELKQNKHKNVYLQNAFNKYGRINFEFYTLEICEKDNLRQREQYYIDFFNSEYNIVKEVLDHHVLGKTVYVYNLEGVFLKKYDYAIEACKELNFSQSSLCRHLNGTFKRCKQYLCSLEYKDKLEPYIKVKKDVTKQYIKVKVTDIKTNVIIYFDSLKECANFLNYFPSEISKGIKTKRLFKRKFLIEKLP